MLSCELELTEKDFDAMWGENPVCTFLANITNFSTVTHTFESPETLIPKGENGELYRTREDPAGFPDGLNEYHGYFVTDGGMLGAVPLGLNIRTSINNAIAWQTMFGKENLSISIDSSRPPHLKALVGVSNRGAAMSSGYQFTEKTGGEMSVFMKIMTALISEETESYNETMGVKDPVRKTISYVNPLLGRIQEFSVNGKTKAKLSYRNTLAPSVIQPHVAQPPTESALGIGLSGTAALGKFFEKTVIEGGAQVLQHSDTGDVALFFYGGYGKGIGAKSHSINGAVSLIGVSDLPDVSNYSGEFLSFGGGAQLTPKVGGAYSTFGNPNLYKEKLIKNYIAPSDGRSHGDSVGWTFGTVGGGGSAQAQYYSDPIILFKGNRAVGAWRLVPAR